MNTAVRLLAVSMCVWLTAPAAAWAGASEKKTAGVTKEQREAAIRRGQVWSPTAVSAMDIKRGPESPKAFTPDELVVCEYVEKKMTGNSPKFTCRLSDN